MPLTIVARVLALAPPPVCTNVARPNESRSPFHGRPSARSTRTTSRTLVVAWCARTCKQPSHMVRARTCTQPLHTLQLHTMHKLEPCAQVSPFYLLGVAVPPWFGTVSSFLKNFATTRNEVPIRSALCVSHTVAVSTSHLLASSELPPQVHRDAARVRTH